MKAQLKNSFELGGWAIFVASACFFLAATIQSGDLLSIAGSGLFLAACFVFMVPLIAAKRVASVQCNDSSETDDLHNQMGARRN